MLEEPVDRRRPWGGNLPGFFWAPQPLEETYLAFFGRPGEDYWLLGARGGLLWGEHLAFWVAAPGFGAFAEPSRNGLVPSLGAFTWCLHLVPSPERAVVGAALQRISPPGNPVLSRRHDFLESSA